MNCFIHLETKQFPLYEGDVRFAHPEIAADLTGENFPLPSEYARVELVPSPAIDVKTQMLGPITAELVDGVWHQKWTVIDLTPEQIVAVEAALLALEKEKEEQESVNSVVTDGAVESSETEDLDFLNKINADVTPINP